MHEHIEERLGHTQELVIAVDARETRFTDGEAGLAASDAIGEAQRMRADVGELDVDEENILEARRRAIANARFDHGQMPTARSPRRVRDAAPPQPRHPRGFEIRQVARVMHDAHQVGLAEAHTDFDAALGTTRIDGDGHDDGRPFCHGRRVPNTENGKRRLPVIQEPAAGQTEEPRPAWHWIGFGAVAIFVVWLPLAYAAEAVSRRLVTSKLGTGETKLADLSRSDRFTVLAMFSVPQVVALVMAGLAGGFLVTRFGRGTRRREAAFAGLAVGLLAFGMTYAQAGFSGLIVPLLAAASAAGGGALGRRQS